MPSAGPPHARVAFRFGQYTDDSQTMRELLRVYQASAAAPGGLQFDGGAYGQRIARLFADAGLLDGHAPADPDAGIVGYGRTTQRAAQKHADGVDWREAGETHGQGNGGCMRAGPLGVLRFREGWAPLLAEAAAQSAVTHAQVRCQATAQLVAGATRLAAESGLLRPRGSPQPAVDASAFCDELAGRVAALDADLAATVLELPAMMDVPIAQAVRRATEVGKRLGDGLWAEGAVISAGAVQAALWAILAFLCAPDDYLACIAHAIRGGGDADTTAAMAGAMVGARLGLDALPAPYVAALNDRGRWTAGELLRLCAELADRAGLRR